MTSARHKTSDLLWVIVSLMLLMLVADRRRFDTLRSPSDAFGLRACPERSRGQADCRADAAPSFDPTGLFDPPLDTSGLGPFAQ